MVARSVAADRGGAADGDDAHQGSVRTHQALQSDSTEFRTATASIWRGKPWNRAIAPLWRFRPPLRIIAAQLGRTNVGVFKQIWSCSRHGDAVLGRARRPRPDLAGSIWISGWPMGFSGAAGEGASAYGNFPSFDFRDVGNGSAYARYNFSNGFFVGSQRNTMGFSGLSRAPSAVSVRSTVRACSSGTA